MGKYRKEVYCLISDENRMYYTAVKAASGDYVISSNSQPYPLSYNPTNLLSEEVQFATNDMYLAALRTISHPLEFQQDGAAILRELYFLRKGREQKAYLTVIVWDGIANIYKLGYYGKIDFSQKDEKSKPGTFTVPTIDDSAWGVLSTRDNIDYSIPCNETNQAAIKVLIDGITLINRYTYQTVQSPIIGSPGSGEAGGFRHTMPFVLVNQDGDSSGIVAKSQSDITFNVGQGTVAPRMAIPPKGTGFFETQYPINGVNIDGSIKFIWFRDHPTFPLTFVNLFFITSTGQVFEEFYAPVMIVNNTYLVKFNFNLNLIAGEEVFLVCTMDLQFTAHPTITPIVTNVTVSTKTKAEPSVVYGLRFLDYIQQLVRKATDGRYEIKSDFFTVNNKTVVTSGEALRGIQNARITSNFKDAFNALSCLNYLCLKNKGGDLYIESAKDTFRSTGPVINILDIGEAIDCSLNSANEYSANRIVVGSPNVDLRHPSGRLEFNAPMRFSLPIFNSDKELNLVPKWRFGCYDIIFLMMDYLGGSTKDNNGDKDVYLLDIVDQQGSAAEDIETFENVNIDDALLEPIIKSPFSNDIITNSRPTVKGVCIPLSNVNIYVDSVLDGNTVADAAGNWSYNMVSALSPYILGVQTGIHVIQATYTDLAAPNTSISVTITTDVTPTLITYPKPSDSLYNNLPLIKGTGQAGDNFNVFLNAAIIGNVTVDGSCKWQLQSVVIPNGNNTITANGATASFFVDSAVDFPLITYIGSELDGFPIVNNMPLIKGVAKPGTAVTIWLNYISFVYLGTTVADGNGNWSFQVVNTSYIDPVSLQPVIIAPIQNGLNIISTSLVNHVVQINVTGFMLNRPAYSSITGVPDNTVFNTGFSPMRMLRAHDPLTAAILNQQRTDKVTFEDGDKNTNLSTTLGAVTVRENSDIQASTLGAALFLLEYASIKVPAYSSFAKILYDFANATLIRFNFKGKDIYCLPLGNMKMSNIRAEIQDWKLLISPVTSYLDLLKLSKTGTNISLMQNQIHRSDYNTLHFVKYNFTQNPKYENKNIYEDWFNNRNGAWTENPNYLQKIKRQVPFADQLTVNGISDITLKIYRCLDATFVASIPYVPIAPAPIPVPEIVVEAAIDMSLYPEDQYFFVICVAGAPVMISERIESKDTWKGCIMIESFSSENKPGYFFSTGAKCLFIVEGLVKKQQPDVDSIVAKEESGNASLLYSEVTRKQIVRFGTAFGLPDYLYLKIADAIALDNLTIEGESYTLGEGEKITPSDDVDGFPMYYYNVLLYPSINTKGISIDATGSGVSGGVLVVDAEAVGLPAGSLIRIELT